MTLKDGQQFLTNGRLVLNELRRLEEERDALRAEVERLKKEHYEQGEKVGSGR